MCHGARLVIEVDGGAHDHCDVAANDAEREAWIRSRGYLVLRFKNVDVLKDVRGVARVIFEEAMRVLAPRA